MGSPVGLLGLQWIPLTIHPVHYLIVFPESISPGPYISVTGWSIEI